MSETEEHIVPAIVDVAEVPNDADAADLLLPELVKRDTKQNKPKAPKAISV
jgi:hypothetical protein